MKATQHDLFVLMAQADQLVKKLKGTPLGTRQHRVWKRALSRFYRRRAELQQLETELYPMEYDDGSDPYWGAA